jgi:thiosulfate dehydrogenase
VSRAFFLGVLALAGCAQPAAVYGEQLFNDPSFAGSQFNVWSCATCHGVSGTETRILPGASLVQATRRPTWFGGRETRLIDAVSFCYVYFMRGPAPLSPDEPRSRALYEYLDTLGPKTAAPAQPMTLVLGTADVPRGSKTRGETVYRAACHGCHGDHSTGRGKNSPLASTLPNVADEYPTLFPGTPAALVFVEKVRHGQFFEVGGNMPFYSKEALSDEDLGALLAYLGQ